MKEEFVCYILSVTFRLAWLPYLSAVCGLVSVFISDISSAESFGSTIVSSFIFIVVLLADFSVINYL